MAKHAKEEENKGLVLSALKTLITMVYYCLLGTSGSVEWNVEPRTDSHE